MTTTQTGVPIIVGPGDPPWAREYFESIGYRVIDGTRMEVRRQPKPKPTYPSGNIATQKRPRKG